MTSTRRSMFVLLTMVGLALLLPAQTRADGGPILTDSELWAMIDEGQQIAVVQVQQDGTAQVDLFISLADRSGQSHEVTFFLPLGAGAADLSVVEETSLAVDLALRTDELDWKLEREAWREDSFREGVQIALLVGSLTTHAAWLSPAAVIWLDLLPMWGLGAEPLATFETASSQVAVYDINPDTDLQALIETTGLDPKVQETLAALQGQQIAVLKLQTQPVNADGESEDRGESTDQPGIHLAWRSTLVPHSAGSTYTYPLGTGQAWANPIELTRVYVLCPPELDFAVDYPQLGDDLSSLTVTKAEELLHAIDDTGRPAFAVDEAYGDFGHIWRAIYVMSNSAQDVVVTSLPGPSPEVERAIRRAKVREVSEPLTWYLAPLAGLLIWVTAWRVVMRHHLGVPYRWREGRLYRDALLWAGVYVLTSLVTLLTFGWGTLWARLIHLLCAVSTALPLTVVLAGLTNAWLFSRSKAKDLEVTRGRAFGAYMLTVLMGNILYFVFAVLYCVIVGAI